MIVQDLLDIIMAKPEYVVGSLLLKSEDSSGQVYKFLELISTTVAQRREIFIATDNVEEVITQRTILTYIEVIPAK